MCGIAGTVGTRPHPPALARMAGAMVHRGPDGEGAWHDDRAGLAFRRLAIIDLHERSSQPMQLGALHLVFNGEIYNYVELREELRGLGHAFVTEGDGEVLLHAWAQWREGALDRVNGMFAFAVWDEARGRLTLATDPFAEKPLFFARTSGGGLAFASDVRALRELDPELGRPDEQALRDFVALGTLPSLPATAYAGVSRLPGAHLGRWEAGRLELRRYWEPRRVAVPADPGDAATHLRALLTDSVRLRLRSDVPVGTSLSGGLDSSIIAALCAQLAPDGVRHAFTATFPGFERDEWPYAQQAAGAARVACHHAVRPQAGELLDDLEALVADQEEPFPSTSIYAQWRVMRAAREAGVVVLLDGQGADELFAGYPASTGAALVAGGPRALGRGLRRDSRATALGALTALGVEHGPRALARHHRRTQGSPYVTAAVVRAAAQSAEPPAPTWAHSGDTLRRELLRQAFGTILPNLLRFADRDSMAHSVEVRLPFLDRRVADFALSLPPGLLVRDGERKALLRDAFADVVPAAILARRDKVGYETPEARWFGEPAARARFGELLLDRTSLSRGWYDRVALERDVRDGWRDVAGLWRAVNAELWLRSLDGQPAERLAA